MMRASYTSASQPMPAICSEDGWSDRLWPWSGCILSSPALMVNPADAHPLMLRIGSFFSAVLPKLQLTGLDLTGVSRVPAVLEQYRADRLNWHGTMRARWGMEAFNTMKEVSEDMNNITWPMLIIQGDADRLVHAQGATILYEKCVNSHDKKLRIWSGGYHELFNDLPSVSDQAMREVTEWITARCH
jgi:alpha-beta hydrolase superfamily lysophospholipase